MWWAVFLACSNSGLDQPDPVATADTAPPPAADCPWVGTWTLSEVKCGAFAYPTFYDVYTGGNLVITQSAVSGCDVTATLESSACRQTEGWTFSAPVGTSVDVTRNGVTVCDPSGCAHGDTPCTVGANALAAQSLAIDDSTGSLSARGLFQEIATTCLPDLGFFTVWAPAG